jgi:3-oxoacyl-[acyl-carrier-protein] synthase-3
MLFHQANLRMIEYIVRKMGYKLEQTFTNVQEIGNTGAASLAIAMSEAVSEGLVKDGHTVVLAAVGAGLTLVLRCGAGIWPEEGVMFKDLTRFRLAKRRR